MSIVLREVIPDGTKWGTLGEYFPHWTDLVFGQDLKGVGSIEFKYPLAGANADLLRGGVYLTVLVDGYRFWHDSIFYVQESMGKSIPGAESESKLTKYGGVSLRGRLDKVRWMPAIGSTVMDNEAFKYTNYTPGEVIRSGVENFWSRSRNLFNDPTYWLNDVFVASDTSWFYRVDEIVEPTTSVDDMITKYQDLGIATARFDGFNLITSHFDWYFSTAVGDKTDSVQLRRGFNLLNAEKSESNKDLVTAVLVKGAADPFTEPLDGFEVGVNVVWVIADQWVIDEYGYHEDVFPVADAYMHDTLARVGKVYLDAHIAPRRSVTYAMVDHLYDEDTGEPIPSPRALIDFQCGDLITVVDTDGTSSQRVYAISMSCSNPSHASIALTLNDYFDDWEVTFDQRLRRLGG